MCQVILVCDWLITSHVTQITRSDWLIARLTPYLCVLEEGDVENSGGVKSHITLQLAENIHQASQIVQHLAWQSDCTCVNEYLLQGMKMVSKIVVGLENYSLRNSWWLLHIVLAPEKFAVAGKFTVY